MKYLLFYGMLCMILGYKLKRARTKYKLISFINEKRVFRLYQPYINTHTFLFSYILIKKYGAITWDQFSITRIYNI